MNQQEESGFSERLKTLIGQESVAAFARKCGLKDSLARKYLDGAEPGLYKIVRIWRSTGCSLTWLAAGDGVAFPGGERLLQQERARYVLEDPSFVRVPHYDVRASAGLGAENESEPIKRYNYFRREWWQREIGRDEADCFSTDVVGDSMAPLLTDRHVPIFYRGENEVRADAIYLFRYQGNVFVKSLERVPGEGYLASSANAHYQPWHIRDAEESDFKVIGRLVFKQLGERV